MHLLQNAFKPGQQRLCCVDVYETLLCLQIRRVSGLNSESYSPSPFQAGTVSRLFLFPHFCSVNSLLAPTGGNTTGRECAPLRWIRLSSKIYFMLSATAR